MISEVTRRNIIDFITASRISWAGRLEEQAFLSRLYDLEKLQKYKCHCDYSYICIIDALNTLDVSELQKMNKLEPVQLLICQPNK